MKPYQFVPLNRKVEREQLRPRNQLNGQYHYGMWELKAKVITPLLVRSGKLAEQNGSIVQGIIMNNGQPVLPGSTVKGVIRSIFEAVTYSCLAKPKLNIFHKSQEIDQYLPEQNRNPCRGPSVCPACQVFGYAAGKDNVGKSLVQFMDFTLQGDKQQWLGIETVPRLFPPLRNIKALGQYLDDEDLFQRKFYTHGQPQNHDGSRCQVVKPGAEFSGKLHYHHLNDDEVGRLAFAFGLGQKGFTLKLGYGKPAYFGSIQFELIAVRPYRSFAFQSHPLSSEQVLELADTVGEHDPFIKGQKDKIRHIFNYQLHKNRTWRIDRYGNKGY